MRPPFRRYAGNKYPLADIILPHLDLPAQDTYWEPFVGGGGLFVAALERGLLAADHQVILTDASDDVVSLWRGLYTDTGIAATTAQLLTLVTGEETDEERVLAYRDLRDAWNEGRREPAVQLALRGLSYNGLWRVNRLGRMNVPPDRGRLRKTPRLDENILQVQAALWHADAPKVRFGVGTILECAGVPAIVPGLGWVVYLDPPYDPQPGKTGFVAYTKEGFVDADQRDTLRLAARWSAAGARVVYSNAATDKILAMVEEEWPRSRVEFLNVRRTIAAKVDARGSATEILVRGLA